MNKANVPTYILAGCAVIVVGLLIRKEFFPDRQYAVPEPIRHIGRFDTLDLGGIQIGREDAKVTIIEFFDYECPFCKKFQKSVDYVIENFEDQLQVQYVHLPLNYHQNAFEAALVAECANRQNHFLAAHEFLFQKQIKLNSINWEAFAKEIKMPETQNFLRCVKNREAAASVKKAFRQLKKLVLVQSLHF